MGTGQRFRRHIPPLFFLIALIALIVAIARPAAIITLPSQYEIIILAMDVSGSMRANDVKLLGGNSAVVDQVASGNLIAGLSDNDDINNAKNDGQAVASILPDQDGAGTLLIPTRIALVKGAPHPDDAKKLIDFLCDPAIEKELIAGRFLAYSVRDTGNVRAMDVDYVECAHQMRHAIETSLNILQDRKK